MLICPDIYHPCAGLPSIEQVIAICAESGPRTNNTKYPTIDPRFFVKYRQHIVEQARTQDYIYGLAIIDSKAPKVPQVYLAFHDGKKGYMVMEFVSAPTVEECLAEEPNLIEALRPEIDAAAAWILRLPIPEDGILGPVGGGIAYHHWFKDSEAPFAFANTAALQTYVNRVLSFARTTERVDFTAEPLCFYDADLEMRNFLYSSQTKQLWRIEFEHIGVFPLSFASYALYSFKTKPVCDLAIRIGCPKTANMKAMGIAAGRLLSVGDCSLGLDGNGRVRPPRPRRQPNPSFAK